MKRYFTIILMLSALVLSLSACGEYSAEDDYTYPDFSIEEEDTDIDTIGESVETTLYETSSEETEDTTEAFSDFLSETNPVEEDLTSNNQGESSTLNESESAEEDETHPESIHDDSKDQNGYCDICGKEMDSDQSSENGASNSGENASSNSVALFNKFYNDNFDPTQTKHSDGSAMDSVSDSYNNSEYILQFQNYENIYKNARDAKGNPALKLGKKAAVGCFEINIPKNVTCVVFKIAKYKDQDSAVNINGVEYTLTKNSNDGEYDEIAIDTSKSKVIVVSTTEKYKSCMIHSIEYFE